MTMNPLFGATRQTAICGFALSFLLFAAVIFAIPSADAAPAPDSFADLAEEKLPAVVNISTVQNVRRDRGRRLPNGPDGTPFEDFFDYFGIPRDRGDGEEGEDGDDDEDGAGAPPVRRAQSLGSGFIISADGYVVTNNHVIAEADEVTVTMTDGEEFEATIIGRDQAGDLAVLKIETERDLPFVTFGDSDAIRVGEWVMTIGNPFGLGGSVTAGIISARHRDINAGVADDFIQTDASINRGNSGGPLFNMDGEVIGVNTAIFSPTGGNIGIGFAIPSKQASHIVSQIREFGRIRRGWLGVSIQSLSDDAAEALGMENAEGAIVSSVTPGSPAAGAGILPGDIIIRFDGKLVEDSRELQRVVTETPVDKRVKVLVIRGGERETLNLTTGERPPEDELLQQQQGGEAPEDVEPTTEGYLGMRLTGITDQHRERLNLPDTLTGVIVNRVARNSEAAQRGVRPGDVIAKINQQDVNELDDVASAIEQAEAEGRPSVLLWLYRGGSYVYIPIPIE